MCKHHLKFSIRFWRAIESGFTLSSRAYIAADLNGNPLRIPKAAQKYQNWRHSWIQFEWIPPKSNNDVPQIIGTKDFQNAYP